MHRNMRGFTLVELLVVIAIIGILVGLTLPAINYARETGRMTTCESNVEQLAKASLHHLESQGHYPTGGWGYRWVGDPDAGYDYRQPGGWVFNILSYIDKDSLRRKGEGLAASQKMGEAGEVVDTPLQLLTCPSRRRVLKYPSTAQYVNARSTGKSGRSDYAANAGSASPGDDQGPQNLAGAESYSWRHSNHNGVVFQRSTVRDAKIEDGAGNTYLVGERYMNALAYTTGKALDDDQSMYAGHCNDSLRWAQRAPRQDTRGTSRYFRFGSTHATGFHMAFCDGSTRRINFNLDVTTHQRMGNRADGQPVDKGQL